MARSTQDQLDAVDAKISEIEGGAQGWIGKNKGVTYPLLASLYKERARLEQKLSDEAANSGSMASLGFQGRPR